MMNRRISFTRIAVVALAGLALGAMASVSIGGVRGTGADTTGRIAVTKVEGPVISLVLESEGGVNGNDVFNSPTMIAAPSDELFAIRGRLSQSDSDGICRDVDFYRVNGLAPLTDYSVSPSGPISDQMAVGWFAGDVLQRGNGAPGKILVTADVDGMALIAVSAQSDADFEGNDDGTFQPHALCGEYHLLFERVTNGDVNGDGLVDIRDVRAMLNVIGAAEESAVGLAADLNRDGIVDEHDLRLLAETVDGRRAQRLANKKADKIEKKKAKIAKKAAKKTERAERRAAKRAGLTKQEVADSAEVVRETLPEKPAKDRVRRPR